MPVIGASEKYRINPHSKVDFQKIDADERHLFSNGGKEEGILALEKLKDELQELQQVLFAENKHRILVVMQAMDTGGKDGCIKNVFSRMDPQGIHVQAFKKPNEEEFARDFLWRVHSKVPRNGELVIFNRSHYEDVIAVKVKKIFPESVWKPRIEHIIDFEKMLSDEGTSIVKIFLHISKEEQKLRLESRLVNPDKHWKFNPDDLKDRALWSDFMKSYQEIISKTSTEKAPWYVVPADRKWYRNLVVARIMVDTMKKLNMKYPKITWNPSEMVLED